MGSPGHSRPSCVLMARLLGHFGKRRRVAWLRLPWRQSQLKACLQAAGRVRRFVARIRQGAYTAAKVELDRLRQEPAPLNLPALGLGVKPSVFLAVAPVLLLILYLRFAGRERTLARMREDLVAMASAYGVDSALLATCMPALESPKHVWLRCALASFPDLAVIATLALLGFNPEWAIPCVAATVALAAAIAFRVPRRRSM